jgi:hypothetical protein
VKVEYHGMGIMRPLANPRGGAWRKERVKTFVKP